MYAVSFLERSEVKSQKPPKEELDIRSKQGPGKGLYRSGCAVYGLSFLRALS